MKAFAIGVDLGGTNLRIAAVDTGGQILEKITTGTEVARGCHRVIDEMCAAISNLAKKHSADGSRLGTTVILENDANGAALGEKWLGAAAGVDDMCMVTLGTGVGGGLVLHGRI